MSANLDALVESTYNALLSVVHTTAVSRRVLQRPPFTFMHKLLVETLEPYGIFTPQQLVFCELVTKEDKAAFLTRALAFVAFAMSNIKEKNISTLLLVSPVKVLAGVAVEDTLDFIRQLCVVCRSTDDEAKENAAREVLAKGDAQLYTAGVTFRRGLVLIQAIIRAFISRRVGKRKQGGVVLNAPVGMSKAAQFQHGFYTSSAPPNMDVGTKFLKELSNGRVYDGVIVAVRGKRYTLRYEQDSEVEDDVDEIEMKILLEESVRLHKLRERMHSPQGGLRRDEAEMSLTSLPDLTPVSGDDGGGRPKITKRSSTSRDLDRLVSQVTSTRPTLMRAMSSRRSVGSTPADTGGVESAVNQPSSTVYSSSKARSSSSRSKLERIQSQLSEELLGEREAGPLNTPPDARDEAVGEANEVKPWQASLKEILAKGQVGFSGEAVTRRNQPAKKATSEAPATPDNRAPSNNAQAPNMSFPELSIPGKRKLPAVQKRKQPTAGFTSPGGISKSQSKAKLAIEELETARSKHLDAPSCTPSHHSSNEATRAGASGNAPRLPSIPVVGDAVVDKAFGGAYQSTDQKTQEKLALFREIVHRIDGYMKRKRLRVIDLFRFCDADGNGSISPQEMIDTLSQMEIQLSPEQAHEFIDYIDKDGNGSIDIDEFEELLRVARRNEAQREQLKKELQHAKKGASGAAGSDTAKSGGNRYAALIKNRHRILDELKSLDIGDVGAVSTSQAKSTILRLQIAGVDEAVVNELLDRSRALLSAPDNSAAASQAVPSTPTSIELAASTDSTVYFQHIAKALNDLEWSKKANRFLDQSWLAQFDSQLERAYRDFELL